MMATRLGCDYSYDPPTTAELVAAGVTFCCRYLSLPWSQKNLTRAEAERLSAAGIDLVVVWQSTKSFMLGGQAAGVADARSALDQATGCGMPTGRPIYFALDIDPRPLTPEQWAQVRGYLDGAASVLGRDRIGVYGGRLAIDKLLGAGTARWGWQTRSWSDGVWSDRAQLHQYAHNQPLGSGLVDWNRAVVDDVGQWSVERAMAELWYPKASRGQLAPVDGGSFTGGPPKGILHTTETTGWPAYATDYWPHFTVRWTGQFECRQHLPINRAARALANPSGGVQTNRDTAIQIEIIGTCDTTKRATWGALYVEAWPTGYKAGIAALMRWIEANAGVPRRCAVTFKSYPASAGFSNGVRLSGAVWDGYSGWCGHQHVPENTHGDPGRIDIGSLLGSEEDDVTKEEYAATLAAERPLLAAKIAAELRPVLDTLITANHLFVGNIDHPEWGVMMLVPPGQLVHVPDPARFTLLSGEGLSEGAVLNLPGDAPIWDLPRNDERATA